MAQKKGKTGNPDGRPKGSKNKTNIALRVVIQNFLENNFDLIKTDFETLQPHQRVKLYIDLLAYALPRLETISVSESELKIENLTDSALDQLTNHIKNSSNE
jgi:hypothetical protein